MLTANQLRLNFFNRAFINDKKSKKKPAAAGETKFSVRDPRHDIAAKKDAVRKTRMVNVLLPLSVLFVLASAISVVLDSQKQKESGGVCVNCDRQREIAEEVYFNKKRPKEPLSLLGGNSVSK